MEEIVINNSLLILYVLKRSKRWILTLLEIHLLVISLKLQLFCYLWIIFLFSFFFFFFNFSIFILRNIDCDVLC